MRIYSRALAVSEVRALAARQPLSLMTDIVWMDDGLPMGGTINEYGGEPWFWRAEAPAAVKSGSGPPTTRHPSTALGRIYRPRRSVSISTTSALKRAVIDPARSAHEPREARPAAHNGHAAHRHQLVKPDPQFLQAGVHVPGSVLGRGLDHPGRVRPSRQNGNEK